MNVLVLYDYYSPYPLRQAFADHLYSFQRHLDAHVYTCNFAFGLPKYLSKVKFDLILFHQIFASQFRWSGLSYESYVKKLNPLKQSGAVKAFFCQDEFFKMNLVNRFVNDFEIDHLFSVAEPSQWPVIYPEVNLQRTKIHKVLTGYLDASMETTLNSLKDIPRTIDIGYRAFRVPPWLGEGGRLKIAVAEKLGDKAKKRGFQTDIKNIFDEKDALRGSEWLKFILSCKGFIGVEGGSSLMDYDGTLHVRVKKYLETHPDASFQEIKRACFETLDGNLSLFALSPRHLEACAAKTCQLLVEGEYSGVLEKERHYLSIKKDFSNVGEVLERFQDPKVRNELTERAFEEIVASKKYRYETFVFRIVQLCGVATSSPACPFWHKVHQVREQTLFKRMRAEFSLFPKVKKVLPKSLIVKLKSLRNRGKGVYS